MVTTTGGDVVALLEKEGRDPGFEMESGFEIERGALLEFESGVEVEDLEVEFEA